MLCQKKMRDLNPGLAGPSSRVG